MNPLGTIMIILTTILLLFSRPKGPAVHKARPDQSGRRFVPEPSFVLPSLPRISAAWAEQAGWLRPIWWNRMRKVDHVTPANQTFPLYSCKQRSTFCCWNSWSSCRLKLLPSPQVTKDCWRSAGTSSLPPNCELLPRQGDKNYYHCIIERISRHIVSCGD